MHINNNTQEKSLVKLSRKLKNIAGNNSAILTLWRILLAYSTTILSNKFLQLLAKLSKKSKRKKFLRRWLKHMQEYNEQQHKRQILTAKNNISQLNNYATASQPTPMTPQYRNSRENISYFEAERQCTTHPNITNRVCQKIMRQLAQQENSIFRKL